MKAKSKSQLKRVLYLITLLLLTALIWVQLYRTQFLPYDENYGQLIRMFLISTVFLATGIVLLARKNELVRNNLAVSIVFLVVNSPVTIIFVAMNYEFLFGTALDAG